MTAPIYSRITSHYHRGRVYAFSEIASNIDETVTKHLEIEQQNINSLMCCSYWHENRFPATAIIQIRRFLYFPRAFPVHSFHQIAAYSSFMRTISRKSAMVVKDYDNCRIWTWTAMFALDFQISLRLFPTVSPSACISSVWLLLPTALYFPCAFSFPFFCVVFQPSLGRRKCFNASGADGTHARKNPNRALGSPWSIPRSR